MERSLDPSKVTRAGPGGGHWGALSVFLDFAPENQAELVPGVKPHNGPLAIMVSSDNYGLMANLHFPGFYAVILVFWVSLYYTGFLGSIKVDRVYRRLCHRAILGHATLKQEGNF